MAEIKEPTTMTATTMMSMRGVLWIPVMLLLSGTTGGEERMWNTEPAFETQGVNVTVIEGKHAILPCSVHESQTGTDSKPVKVVWTDQWSTILTFQEKTIIDDERIHVDHAFAREWNLRVERVKYGDQGIYTCQINTDPGISYTVHLTVVVPPRLVNDGTGEVVEVLEGTKAELVCNATGIPAPTITWFRKPAVMADRRERIGEAGQVLVIHNVTRYCGGTYECVAENGVPPSKRKEIKVKVKFQPEVTLPNKRMSQEVGRLTILECMVTAHPQGEAMWKFRGKKITSNEKYSVNIYPQHGTDMITLSLTIRNLESEDFGKYNCIASNSLGETSKKMLLYEKVLRTKPTTTTTTSTTTMSTTTTAASRLLPPVQRGHLGVRDPQADRRVHSDGRLEGRRKPNSDTEQSVPPQPLDSNGRWQRPPGHSSESEAKTGRIANSSSGPRQYPLLIIISSLLAYVLVGLS